MLLLVFRSAILFRYSHDALILQIRRGCRVVSRCRFSFGLARSRDTDDGLKPARADQARLELSVAPLDHIDYRSKIARRGSRDQPGHLDAREGKDVLIASPPGPAPFARNRPDEIMAP